MNTTPADKIVSKYHYVLWNTQVIKIFYLFLIFTFFFVQSNSELAYHRGREAYGNLFWCCFHRRSQGHTSICHLLPIKEKAVALKVRITDYSRTEEGTELLLFTYKGTVCIILLKGCTSEEKLSSDIAL